MTSDSEWEFCRGDIIVRIGESDRWVVVDKFINPLNHYNKPMRNYYKVRKLSNNEPEQETMLFYNLDVNKKFVKVGKWNI